MTLGTAMDLDTRITGAPLPPSMARISESPMDTIIILSETGLGPGLDFHMLMITPDPSSSQGITLPDHPETEDGTSISNLLTDHDLGILPGILLFMDQEKIGLRSASFLSDHFLMGRPKQWPLSLKTQPRIFLCRKALRPWQPPCSNWASHLLHVLSRNLLFKEQGLPKSPKVRSLLPRDPSPSSPEAAPLNFNHNSPLSTSPWSPPLQEATVPNPLLERSALLSTTSSKGATQLTVCPFCFSYTVSSCGGLMD